MPNTDLVCDASALFEWLVVSDRSERISELLAGSTVHAPHLAIFELIETLRNAERGTFISKEEALAAVEDALELDIEYWPMDQLADRVWELRHNVTAYDASYVALAETLDAPLLTIDERLVRAPGPRCQFVVP